MKPIRSLKIFSQGVVVGWWLRAELWALTWAVQHREGGETRLGPVTSHVIEFLGQEGTLPPPSAFYDLGAQGHLTPCPWLCPLPYVAPCPVLAAIPLSLCVTCSAARGPCGGWGMGGRVEGWWVPPTKHLPYFEVPRNSGGLLRPQNLHGIYPDHCL